MPPITKMGVAATCYLSVMRPRETLTFLEHCATLGAGGIQMQLSSFEPEYLKKLRSRAEELGMYLELMGPLPTANDDTQFRRTLAAGRELGAACVRVGCLSGRRYESFDSLEKWKDFVNASKDSLIRAASIVEKEKFPVALENHKDWTVEEMTALMKQFSSEYFGVCLDTGNNISFLEDAMVTIEGLLPYVITTHVKDMAVKEYADGFLMSEVNFGQGMLDIPRIVGMIRARRPKANIVLEMITRDPLKVPCLTQKYWLTFGDRSGYLLAKSLRMTKDLGKAALPGFSEFPKEKQARMEDDNVATCLKWAANNLQL